MGVLITIAIIGGIILWIWKGRESTGAIVSNFFLVIFYGLIGVVLLVLGSGWAILGGIGCILYALYGAYETIPWIQERLDPEGR